MPLLPTRLKPLKCSSQWLQAIDAYKNDRIFKSNSSYVRNPFPELRKSIFGEKKLIWIFVPKIYFKLKLFWFLRRTIKIIVAIVFCRRNSNICKSEWSHKKAFKISPDHSTLSTYIFRKTASSDIDAEVWPPWPLRLFEATQL